MDKSLRKKLIVVGLAVVLISSAVAALFLIEIDDEENSTKLQAVATFYPLYFFAKEVGGDRADVASLIPNNMEPHSWNPRPSDIVAVNDADVFVYNGAGFEPWADDFIAQLGEDVAVVDTSQDIAMLLSDEVEELYIEADEILALGNATEVNLTYSLPHMVVDLEEGLYSLGMDMCAWSNCTAMGGSLTLNVSEEGDIRLFLSFNADLTMLDPMGEAIEPEATIGPRSDYPDFKQAIFLEVPVGLCTLKFNHSDTNMGDIVILAGHHDHEEGGEEEGHEHGINDPHFWLDPISAMFQVDSIAQAFGEKDPANATYFDENAAALKARLAILDQDFRDALEGRSKNDIITTHEGFHYLANRYGFKAHAAIGISGDEQPSAQDMLRLVDLIEDLGLDYVFGEPTYNDAIIEQIADQTVAQVLVLDGVHGRSGVNAEKDYFEIMYANLEALKTGLEVTP